MNVYMHICMYVCMHTYKYSFPFFLRNPYIRSFGDTFFEYYKSRCWFFTIYFWYVVLIFFIFLALSVSHCFIVWNWQKLVQTQQVVLQNKKLLCKLSERLKNTEIFDRNHYVPIGQIFKKSQTILNVWTFIYA